MRKKRTRTPVMLALAGLLASLITFVSSGTASAAESIPELQWPAVKTSRYTWDTVTSPSGVTTACTDDNGTFKNLKTYNSSGQVVRDLDASQSVDGVTNCVYFPVVDKNGVLYGKPYGKNASGSWTYNTNVVAYNANTVKWKYDTGCTSQAGSPVVGADGNIYAISNTNGTRLIGLTPDVAPPTTQPKKVLDVPLTGSGLCSVELFATKDGVGYVNESRAYFYSYSGKPLGISPSGSRVSRVEQVNANGRAFYPIFVGSGSTASFKLVAYSLNLNKVDWTALESLFGQNPTFNGVYSTPDGGAIVYLNRQKVVNGAPTTERVSALVKLNTFGQKLWEKDLPNQDASGNPYNGGYVVADTTGKVAFVREVTLPTNDTNNRTMPAISIGVFDGNGNVVYDQIMRGNLDKASGGVNGYYLGGQGYMDPAIGPGTLYFFGVCKGTCATYSETKLYPIKVTGLGLDYPRGAVLTVPPLKPFAALGDSYSSGLGAGVYDTDTVTATNKCYKSYNGYGRILGRDTSNPLTLTNFAACGGSVTDNIDTNTTYPGVTQKQDEVLSSDTKVVSLTIGGNDIGFGDVITTCADPTKDCDGAYGLAYNRLGVLDNKLQRVYLDILQKAPNAKVYILGYPPIVTTGPGCLVGNNGSDYPIFSESRKQKAVDLANSLNTAIQTNVNTIRQLSNYDQRLKFIDAAASGSPFIGHDVCSSDPYVNGLILPPGNSSESFHPNPKGMKAYADLLAANMN